MDAITTLTKFVNELSTDLDSTRQNAGKGLAALAGELGELKAWFRDSIREELDRAPRELRTEIEQAMSQRIERSRQAQKQAEREVAELEKLLASSGPKKSVHLVRDGEGRVTGAVVRG